MNRETTLVRSVRATAIPSGEPAALEAGTTVFVAQTLGGNTTVRTAGGLFRIDGADAEALGAGFGLPAPGAASQTVAEFSERAVWGALETCFDPEIPVNIVDLGLIYDLVVEEGPGGKKNVAVKMTLTAPGCGMGPVIAEDARRKIEALPDVGEARVSIVWDPVWTPQMISEKGRQILGLE
jgi:probable FeS assembly SUF system protein SufT